MSRRVLAVAVALPGAAVVDADAAEPAVAPEPGDATVGVVLGASGARLVPLPVGERNYILAYVGFHNHWAPAIGIGFQSKANGAWSFAPEIWYTQFGSAFGSSHIAFDTIAVPFLFRRHAERHRPVAPFVELGPEVSFAIQTRVFSTLLPYSYAYIATYGYGVKELLLRGDVGLRAGAGVSFPLANARGSIGVRVYRGIVPKILVDDVPPLFNQQISVVGGIAFGRAR